MLNNSEVACIDCDILASWYKNTGSQERQVVIKRWGSNKKGKVEVLEIV